MHAVQNYVPITLDTKYARILIRQIYPVAIWPSTYSSWLRQLIKTDDSNLNNVLT